MLPLLSAAYSTTARPSSRKFDRQAVFLAFCWPEASTGNSKAARMAMTAITTNNSTNVKAGRLSLELLGCIIRPKLQLFGAVIAQGIGCAVADRGHTRGIGNGREGHPTTRGSVNITARLNRELHPCLAQHGEGKLTIAHYRGA